MLIYLQKKINILLGILLKNYRLCGYFLLYILNRLGYMDKNIQLSAKELALLSQTNEYALRAALWLGSHGTRAQTTEQIAKGTQVPAGYLSKVLQILVRAGLVSSQRGLGGGYALARPAAEITALDIVNAVDPIKRTESCPLEIEEHGKRLCPLHYRLHAATALIEDSFRSCTIADLCEPGSMTSPFCAKPADDGEASD